MDCSTCGKTYKTKGRLAIHIKTCNQNICEYCKKKFSSSATLKTHNENKSCFEHVLFLENQEKEKQLQAEVEHFNNQIKFIQSERQAEVEQLKQKIASLEAEHRSTVTSLEAEHRSTVTSLEAEHRSTITSHESKYQTMKSECEKLTIQVNMSNILIEQLKESKNTLDRHYETTNKTSYNLSMKQFGGNTYIQGSNNNLTINNLPVLNSQVIYNLLKTINVDNNTNIDVVAKQISDSGLSDYAIITDKSRDKIMFNDGNGIAKGTIEDKICKQIQENEGMATVLNDISDVAKKAASNNDTATSLKLYECRQDIQDAKKLSNAIKPHLRQKSDLVSNKFAFSNQIEVLSKMIRKDPEDFFFSTPYEIGNYIGSTLSFINRKTLSLKNNKNKNQPLNMLHLRQILKETFKQTLAVTSTLTEIHKQTLLNMGASKNKIDLLSNNIECLLSEETEQEYFDQVWKGLKENG